MKIKVLCFSFLLNAFFINAQNDNVWKYKNLKICKESTGFKFDISDYQVALDTAYYFINEKKLIKAYSEKWVKKNTDRNCLSADPNNCLVWCLVAIPAEYATKERIIWSKDVTIESGRKYYKEVIETVCTDNIPEVMFDALATKLAQIGYIRRKEMYETVKNYRDYYRERLFDAMLEYQKDNNLHQGFFDIETLETLEIVVK